MVWYLLVSPLIVGWGSGGLVLVSPLIVGFTAWWVGKRWFGTCYSSDCWVHCVVGGSVEWLTNCIS